MPSGSSQKGTSKKGGSAIHKQSRTSTPVPTTTLPQQEPYDPDFLNTRVTRYQNSIGYDELIDPGASNAAVPESRSIDAMLSKIKDMVGVMEKRSNFYDRGMRFLADERKKRPDDYAAEDEGKRLKHKKRKNNTSDSLAPPDAGSHSKSNLSCHTLSSAFVAICYSSLHHFPTHL